MMGDHPASPTMVHDTELPQESSPSVSNSQYVWHVNPSVFGVYWALAIQKLEGSSYLSIIHLNEHMSGERIFERLRE